MKKQLKEEELKHKTEEREHKAALKEAKLLEKQSKKLVRLRQSKRTSSEPDVTAGNPIPDAATGKCTSSTW